MSAQVEQAAAQFPRTIDEAENEIVILKDEISRIGAQLNDPDRKAELGPEFHDWYRRASYVLRSKKDRIRRISVWLTQTKRERGAERRKPYPGHSAVAIGGALKAATQQYGLLHQVLVAAEAYLSSQSEEDDETLYTELVKAVEDARAAIPIPEAETEAGQ